MSSVVHHEGRVWSSDILWEEQDWLRDCANPCLKEICPVEVLLPKKWTRKFVFLSPCVGRPEKAFLEHASVSKLSPWAMTNIKCSNRKNGMWEATIMQYCRVEHHLLRHCRSRFFTTVHIYSMLAVHCCAVVRRCFGLISTWFAQSTLSVARTGALLRYPCS